MKTQTTSAPPTGLHPAVLLNLQNEPLASGTVVFGTPPDRGWFFPPFGKKIGRSVALQSLCNLSVSGRSYQIKKLKFSLAHFPAARVEPQYHYHFEVISER